MNRDKQIEEKTCHSCIHFDECRKTFLSAKANGLWESTTEEEYFSGSVRGCDFYGDKAIYRKASDLAMEIFEEIEKITMHNVTSSHGIWLMSMGEVAFAELKKKYTEEITEGEG